MLPKGKLGAKRTYAEGLDVVNRASENSSGRQKETHRLSLAASPVGHPKYANAAAALMPKAGPGVRVSE